MPCIAPNPPTLTIEISAGTASSGVAQFKIYHDTGSPLYVGYPDLDTSSSLHNVSVNTVGNIAFSAISPGKPRWGKCLNIVFVIDPNFNYEFDMRGRVSQPAEVPIDFYPAINDHAPGHDNPINAGNCDTQFGVMPPGDLQLEGPIISTQDGRKIILSFTYHNHTSIDDPRVMVSAKPDHYNTDMSYYRLRIIPYPSVESSKPICLEPIVPNGDGSNPKAVISNIQVFGTGAGH